MTAPVDVDQVLSLRLLIDSEHDGVRWRVHIEFDYLVGKLGDRCSS